MGNRVQSEYLMSPRQMVHLGLLVPVLVCSEDVHLHVHLEDMEHSEETGSDHDSRTTEVIDNKPNGMDYMGFDYNFKTTEVIDKKHNGMDYIGMCNDLRRDCRSRARGAGKCGWKWAKRDCKKTCKHCTESSGEYSEEP